MTLKLRKQEKGFTIIEVLIVLAIAGLIMLIVFLAVPALQRSQRNGTRTSEAGRWAASVTECLANRNGVTGSCSTAAQLNVGATNQLTGFGAANTTSVLLQYGTDCTADGSGTAASTQPRNFTVTYQLEPAIPRCIGG